jgi:bifunctional non-homologous end joining protein LigD
LKIRLDNLEGYVIEGVKISHPDRVMIPDAGLTKAQLAEFYASMAEFILADIRDRPITVVRCPGGISKQCFYQRGKETLPSHIYRIDIVHDGKKHAYMFINDVSGLIELVQMSVIEIHPWGVRKDGTEKPDRIIFDLDPAPNVPFEAVRRAAADVRQRLDDAGLVSFARVTGGKGIHVIVPIQRRHDWTDIKKFSRHFAERMVRDMPEAYVSTMSKKKRDGRILIDYLRNSYSATTVMNYCVRARSGAPVTVPVEWDEMDALKSADQFHISDVKKRWRQASRLQLLFANCRQSLTKKILAKYS